MLSEILPSRVTTLPPLWREARTGLELAALLRHPVYRGEGVAPGHDAAVLLIPGFLAGDNSLGVMTGWLRRMGYWTSSAGIRWNVNCATAALDVLEGRLEAFAQRRGRQVSLVGQSRGGAFARALGMRRPDLVRGVVTLGTPHLDPLAIHPVVRAQVYFMGALGTLGAPRLLSRTCLTGDCCRELRDSFDRPFPGGVGYVSVYSRSDGIVDWRCCLDPDAEQVEVDSSHIGMSVNAGAYRAIAAGLESFAVRPAAAAA
jgi:pimeloyl-ACP methyl ester carboxylesterase